jgi:hypothetical protein
MFGDYQFNQPLFNDQSAESKLGSGGGIVGAFVWFFQTYILGRGRS